MSEGRPSREAGASPSATAGQHALAWTLAATLGAALLVVGWSVVGHLLRDPRIGDGVRVESYGFDLSDLRVDRRWLAASGHARDFLPALDGPESLAGTEVAEFNRRHRRRPVVSADRVIGVVVGGESRAYPLPLLEAHEIVNDTLAGVPIAICYSPLADAVVVLDRRAGGDALTFGLSGLLFSATHLLYDREAVAAGEPPSLFSPLLGSVVAGPLAGASLRRIPGVSVARWDAWLEAHPDTTVARGDEGSRQRGRQISYAHYLDSPEVPFPVEPPEGDAAEPHSPSKSASIAWQVVEGEWSIATLADLAASADGSGWVPIGPGVAVRVDPRGRSVLVRSDAGAETPILIPCMQFAAESIASRERPPEG
jgi:hypothetical protein